MVENLKSVKTVDSDHVKRLINTLSVDNRQNKLFLGTDLGLQRYDIPKYAKLTKFFNNQLLLFWRPEQYTLDSDRNDFKLKLGDHGRKIFTQNLGFQIVLDTIQARGIKYLLDYCTNSELEQAFTWWEAFENLHSYSYSYIIRNVYPDPTSVFDGFEKDENILKRVAGCTKYYDDLINSLGDSEEDIKKKIYLTFVSVQILEAVRFYVSFACSYYFAENDMMVNNAKIIQLINRDENLHLGLTKDIIKILRDNKTEGFQDIIEELKPVTDQMWIDAYNEECAWAEYLFEEGEYMGLNADLLKQYMGYLINQRMKICGFDRLPQFEGIKNPFRWIDKWIDSSGIQLANQETDQTSYTVNGTSGEGLDDTDDLLEFLDD